MLIDGHELHIPRAGRLQEAVDIGSPSLPRLADGREGIELRSCPVKSLQGVHHGAERPSPLGCLPETVVDVLRSVEGKPEEEVIVPEK